MNIGSSSFIERLLCSDLLGRLWKPFFVDGHAHVCAFFLRQHGHGHNQGKP